MNRVVRTALVLALFACANLLLISPARAQSVYGSIFGTVTDKSGAAVANATVTVTDEAKGTVVTAISNASGDYSVPHLIPDMYDLKVTAQGFKNFETKGITVQADTAPRIDPTMDVGGASETVQVNADEAPQLKTDRADVATVFDQQQVNSLPVGDQNFTNLQLLLPGAQKLGWSHAADENPQGSQQIQVDGQAFGGTAFELDGTDNQDPILGIIVINPAMDSVTETKITTQNFDAELGKAVSAVVTAQTRSGTNSYHGSAYDFRTGNANQARDPYTQQGGHSIPPGLKNRFGGSLGGRVIRDKFFMFGNYEGQRQKVGTSSSDTVPTQNLINTCLSGNGCDFSEYATQLAGQLGGKPLLTNNTSDQSPETNAAFANNIIPNSLLSGPSLTLLNLLKPYAPNTGGGSITNNFSEGGTGLFNSDQWTIRGDYTINEKMHAFGRFSRFTDVLSGKVMFGDAGGPGFGIGGYGGDSSGDNRSLASGMDIALNAHLLTDWRFGYYKWSLVDSKYSNDALADKWGIPGINSGPGILSGPFTAGAPGWFVQFPFTGTQASFGAGLNINRCNCPLSQDENQYQFVNNWTIIRGNHSIKIGADLRFAYNLRVPSDTDRAGQFTVGTGPTSANGSNGLGWATFVLGESTSFGRYVSTTTTAKENQPRYFFYGQDTWRVTHNLTLNLGLRYELYLPESVNAKGNGSLMNLKDGYMHVAGIGGIGKDMGWSISYGKMFDPRIGLAYQLNDKTVIRAGYGRSFDTGVFGSIFGHVVTQNLPVLANQSLNSGGTTGSLGFTLSQGPPAFTFPTTPDNGLLPAQAYAVAPKARPDPLHFPTIDAWNLSLQRAISPTLTFTMAYVGNKGTHTLGDTDQNNTDPNESALFLPGEFSRNGQTLHWDPSAPKISPGSDGIAADGGVSNGRLLKRYYAGSLAACKDANYIAIGDLQTTDGDPHLTAGQCGWTSNISYYGDDQNTEFDALQVTLAKTMSKGLSVTTNYQWASAFGDANGYWTWSHVVTHYRDSNVRRQQLVLYGSYDLPFGHGRQFAAGASPLVNMLIGGYQLSAVANWSAGLPFGLGYSNFGGNQDCNNNVGGTAAPCRPNAHGRLKTNLSSFDPNSHTRTFWTPQSPSGGLFTFPGLDVIGNGGNNNYEGPSFFNTDVSLAKTFTIHESIAAVFRFDTFNTFNHINAGNPNTTNIFSSGPISGQAAGATARYLTLSGRVQF